MMRGVTCTVLAMTIATTAAADDQPEEVIVVTGSSIEHDAFTGRTPMTVITRADLEASGRATLGDILQSMPAQANGANAQVNAAGDGATRIDLRGLGAGRTLVLLNGRRFVNGGNGADASVDVNAIPLAMIERVEILKDGASAIYGADAVGGVVNIITRKQLDGSEIALLSSTSQHGDGSEIDASFVQGYTTDDRTVYLMLSAGFQHHGAVLASDRPFSAVQKTYDFATHTETHLQSLAGPTGRLDASSIGGGVALPGCPSGICKPDGNGGWTDFQTPNDLYNEATSNYLYTPSTRYNVFGTGGKRLNEHTALFVELMYQRRNSDRQLSPVAFNADAPISANSIYNPFGADVLDFRRRITELGARQFLDEVSTFRLVAGISGDIPEGTFQNWTYELSVNYGDTKSLVATTGQLLKNRVADALGPSMLDRNGTPICVRDPGNPASQIVYTVTPPNGGIPIVTPCVPLNILAGSIPRDQLKGLTYQDAGTGDDAIQGVLATASGQVVQLPHHGDISLTVGGDFRDETGTQSPPSVASSGDSTDNLAQATNAEFQGVDGYGEVAIVPITGDDIARRVELDLGARALYRTHAGSALTYKAGGLFRTVGGLSLRATYATAFRAPSFFDLYGGHLERTPNAEDPCDTRPPSAGDGTKTLDPNVQAQCTAQMVPTGSKFETAQQLTETGGNPALKPERARTLTAGVVFEPLKGLALSADYWRIDIRDAIETLGIQTIFANCYDRGEQAFCDQIHRDPITHRIDPVDELLQNVSHTITSGIDLAVLHDLDLCACGRVHTMLQAQYLITHDIETAQQVIHGAGYYDLGVFPRFKANLASRWTHRSGASAGFLLQFVGSYKECASDDCNTNLAASRDVARYYKLDLFGGYDLPSSFGRTSVQLGVNNVFNATPPLVYNAAEANSDATAYDFIGRLVYARITQRF